MKGIGLYKQPGTNVGSIGYWSLDGRAYVEGSDWIYGAKFGSYDVIGCGITRSGSVFFTHNGLVLPKIETYFESDIYAVVSLNGKDAAVKINFGRKSAGEENYVFYTDFEKEYANP